MVKICESTFPPAKGRPTEPVPCEVHILKSWCASVNQKLGVVTSAPQKPDGPELETGREHYEVIEDELCTPVAPRVQLEVEGTIEEWGSLNIGVGTAAPYGVGVVLETLDPQIPKVRKPTDEIKNLLVIPPRKFQFQRLQGIQEPPEEGFHPCNKRRGV